MATLDAIFTSLEVGEEDEAPPELRLCRKSALESVESLFKDDESEGADGDRATEPSWQARMEPRRHSIATSGDPRHLYHDLSRKSLLIGDRAFDVFPPFKARQQANAPGVGSPPSAGPLAAPAPSPALPPTSVSQRTSPELAQYTSPISGAQPPMASQPSMAGQLPMAGQAPPMAASVDPTGYFVPLPESHMYEQPGRYETLPPWGWTVPSPYLMHEPYVNGAHAAIYQGYAPPYGPPMAAAPMAAAPMVAQPMMAQAMVAQPMVAQPMVAQPMVAQPMVAQPMVPQPMVPQPMVAQPMVPQPMVPPQMLPPPPLPMLIGACRMQPPLPSAPAPTVRHAKGSGGACATHTDAGRAPGVGSRQGRRGAGGANGMCGGGNGKGGHGMGGHGMGGHGMGVGTLTNGVLTHASNRLQTPLAELAKEQHGSRRLQEDLPRMSDAQLESACAQLAPHLLELSYNTFGNFLVSRLASRPQARPHLLSALRGSILSLVRHTQGSRVVQSVLNALPLAEAEVLVEELRGEVVRCAEDTHGSWGVCAAFKATRAVWILQEVADAMPDLCMRQHGVRVIQTIMQEAAEHAMDTAPAVEALLRDASGECAFELSLHSYGNYAVQACLRHGPPEGREQLLSILLERIVPLSAGKHGSNVAEALLMRASAAQRQQVHDAIFGEGAAPARQTMLRSQYGNYVIQAVLRMLDDEQRARALQLVQEETQPDNFGQAVQTHWVAASA
tara:strand:- start:2255 stop:4441 length:2187 start_codon:yes stop_codon:yes gene_type:complete